MNDDLTLEAVPELDVEVATDHVHKPGTHHTERPLWLPIGSVRAIVAMGLVGAFIFAAVEGLQEATAALAALAGAVVTHYFEKRREQQKTNGS